MKLVSVIYIRQKKKSPAGWRGIIYVGAELGLGFGEIPVLGIHQIGVDGVVEITIAAGDGGGQVAGIATAQGHTHEIVETVTLEGTLKGHLVDDHVFQQWKLWWATPPLSS